MEPIQAGYWTSSYPTPAMTDMLYRNNGDGSFTNTEAPGIHQLRNNDDSSIAAATGDFNGDGLIDVIVTTLSPQRTRLSLNQGDLSFVEVLITPSAPTAFSDYANGIAVTDYDNALWLCGATAIQRPSSSGRDPRVLELSGGCIDVNGVCFNPVG